jgi:hypothetical protein
VPCIACAMERNLRSDPHIADANRVPAGFCSAVTRVLCLTARLTRVSMRRNLAVFDWPNSVDVHRSHLVHTKTRALPFNAAIPWLLTPHRRSYLPRQPDPIPL